MFLSKLIEFLGGLGDGAAGVHGEAWDSIVSPPSAAYLSQPALKLFVSFTIPH
jgi:hypothetical protein